MWSINWVGMSLVYAPVPSGPKSDWSMTAQSRISVATAVASVSVNEV